MVDEPATDAVDTVETPAEAPDEKKIPDIKEVIQYTVADAGTLRKRFTVTVPAEHVRRELDQSYGKIFDEAVIPGFRKGHAPRKLIEKRYSAEVGDEVLTKLLSTSCMAAFDLGGVKPLGDPVFRVSMKTPASPTAAPASEAASKPTDEAAPANAPAAEMPAEAAAESQAAAVPAASEAAAESAGTTPDAGAPATATATAPASRDKLVDFHTALEEIELPTNGPLTFTCEVEVKPEIVLPELDNIPVKRPTATVTTEDIATAIERLRRKHGTFVPVTDDGVIADDLVVGDMKVTVPGTLIGSEPEVIMTEQNVQFYARPQRVEGVVLSNLGEVLTGSRPGDVRTLQGQVADDAEREDLRGKTATFEIKVNDIKRLELPPMGADFLSQFGCETEDDLRDYVRQHLEQQLDDAIQQGMYNQIAQYLLENVPFDLPEQLSSRQIERAVQRRVIQMRREGVPMSEIKKHADEISTDAGARALVDLKLMFIFEKIGEKLEIEITEEEVNSEIAAMARKHNLRFDRMRDELNKQGGLDEMATNLRDQRVMKILLANAAVSDMTPSTIVAEST